MAGQIAIAVLDYRRYTLKLEKLDNTGVWRIPLV
jgi:hypothetical protein